MGAASRFSANTGNIDFRPRPKCSSVNACLVYLQQGSGIYISQRTSDVSERHRMLSEMGHPNHKWDSESSAFSFGRRCTQFLQEVAQ